MNGEWIRRFTLPELEARALPLAEARFGADFDRDLFRAALRIGQERAVTIGSLLEQMDFLFVEESRFAIPPAAWDKVVATDRVGEVLDLVAAHLESCEWTVDGVDLRDVLNGAELKVRKVMPAIYGAVEGRTAGLPLFDSLVLLGRDRARGRVVSARARLEG
jgi:glutamyl-tRNA synthetase